MERNKMPCRWKKGVKKTGKKKKWGKIGAPHSKKRKNFLKKIRKKK